MSLEHPKPTQAGGFPQSQGGFWWKGAIGDEQEAAVGMELDVAVAEGCPVTPHGVGSGTGEPDQAQLPTAFPSGPAAGAPLRPPSLAAGLGRAGCSSAAFSLIRTKTRPQRGNGEEEWPVAALPSPHTSRFSLPPLALLGGCRHGGVVRRNTNAGRPRRDGAAG